MYISIFGSLPISSSRFRVLETLQYYCFAAANTSLLDKSSPPTAPSTNMKKIRTRTRRAMRAGRKFNRHQIYGFCFDNWSDTLRRMEWKKPYSCSPALMYCCRPPAENNWKIPKRLIPCKEPCNFCECAGLQRNRSKEPKKGIEATFATTVNKGKWILSNPHFG